jgi:hypothetical protein
MHVRDTRNFRVNPLGKRNGIHHHLKSLCTESLSQHGVVLFTAVYSLTLGVDFDS